MFGHEGVKNFVLHFRGPLLIDSGYPITRQELQEALEKDLHPLVTKYLTKCLDESRILKLFCRDVLKKTYDGRLIYQFVECIIIPKPVKDFFLLNPDLKCLDTDQRLLEREETLSAISNNTVE